MKEDFLHYLWKFKNFDSTNLKTSNEEPITIIHSGQYLQRAGPDFFNAQIIIGNQKWAGNVEIHLKSSDWYIHQHENDPAYENVILHVVWEHDTEIFRKNNDSIPVLELKDYVGLEVLENYQSLMLPKSWIFCEKQLKDVEEFIVKNWFERLFFERLERKSLPIQKMLSETENDWEAVLFYLLAKNFGLNVNGDIFSSIAQSIGFSVIRKESENIEALLFGMSGLLEADKEDIYFKYLQSSWEFLSHKYQLPKPHIDALQFFKHRPDNFPTIRLSQLAQLYFSEPHLFSKIIDQHNVEAFYEIFKVGVSDYWLDHYQFDRVSPKKRKMLTHSFIDLLLLNSIIPIQFAFALNQGKDVSEQLIALSETLPAENNIIIEKFAFFGIKSKSAFDTQALLQLKNEYCNKSRCTECAIGSALLKSGTGQKNVVPLKPL